MAENRQRVATATFPPACGVYIVWESGRADRPLYVGVAATQTIDQRWRRQHLRSRAGGSALRRSLGVHLALVAKKLNLRTDGRFYPPDVEAEITGFLDSCDVEFRVAQTPHEARAIENELIRQLRPLLNVRGRRDLQNTQDDPSQ
jgi:hypothetical protein